MNVFDCRQEKIMTQIFETHLYLTAGFSRKVGIASGQVLWKAVAASGQVLYMQWLPLGRCCGVVLRLFHCECW